MTELLAGLCGAVHDAGYEAQLVSSEFPPPEADLAYVVIPHEHQACEPARAWPSREQRERTIALCVENPFTPWFETVSRLAPQFAALLAINRSSVAELRRRGLRAEHIQLGYTPAWDSWRGREEEPRPIDVTYLGSADRRRDAILASYGRWFWHRRTAMLKPPLAVKPGSRPDYLVDRTKYEHLRRAKMLVNLHREGCRSFEWVRALQAIANGCVVVSEPSSDHAPLVAGEHFVVADARSVPHVVEGLLEEPERLHAIRHSAYEMVRGELDMSGTVEGLVGTARALVDGPARGALAVPTPSADGVGEERPRRSPPDDVTRLRIAVRNLSTETLELRRGVQRLLERSEGRDPKGEPERVYSTPAYRDARPRVSVSVTLHNYQREVVEALASVAVSEYEDYEVIVLDDASTDRSLTAARDFLLDHPWLPAAILRQRANRGLGASRNALARQARGELMFVLDADNAIFPSALGRLVETLDGDPGAAFAYSLIAVTRSGEHVGLTSQHAWDPARLAAGNYLDAMALIRLDDYTALGGYTEDVRITGWEDFHFWCACAESGRRGTLVPEVLACYRETDHSMLSWMGTDVTTAWSLIHARYPGIVPPAPRASGT